MASLLASPGRERYRLRFLAVETAFLQRIFMLFFISVMTRRVEYIVCSSNPDGRWVAQQARKLFMQLGNEQPFRFLVHDRDGKFGHAFDEVFRSEGIKVILTPVQAPNANAHAERWVSAVRADCLDRILIPGRRHLEHVPRVYAAATTNTCRTYGSCRRTAATRRPNATASLRRRDLLGGLIHDTRPREFANPTRP